MVFINVSDESEKDEVRFRNLCRLLCGNNLFISLYNYYSRYFCFLKLSFDIKFVYGSIFLLIT